MARLYSCGFELNSTTNGVEVTTWLFTGTTNGTIVTSPTVTATSTYAAKYAVSASKSVSDYQFSTGTGVVYMGAWVNFSSFPSANTCFMDFGTAAAAYCAAYINSSGQIGVNTGASPGTYNATVSSALSLNTWYYVELKLDCSSANSQIATVRLNGTTIQSQTGTQTESANSATLAAWGAALRETSATMTVYFDDIVINDNTGTTQNTYPWDSAGGGAGSNLAIVRPNGTGDSNGFLVNVGGTAGTANNYTRVDEVTPDNATTYNASNVLNASDLFTVGSSGIAGGSTINVVQIGGVIANITGVDATTAMEFQAEQASGGTIAKSASIIPDTTTWTTNGKNVPHNYPLTLYNNPTGSPWTTAEVGTSPTMEIGYTLDASHTDAVGVTTVWAYIDYSPSSAVNASVTQVGATLTFTGGTQSIVAQSSASVTQSAASLTFTGGTQVVATVNKVSISQVAATLTFTGGTQAVATVNFATVSQVVATLTFSGGTQTVVTLQTDSVSQSAATLTFTGGTQTIVAHINAPISQSAATLMFSGGTQSVATINDVAISQAHATLTFTGATQTIATTRIVSIAQVGASLTFTGGTQSVTSVQDVSISQAHATLTFSGGTQVIASVNYATVAQSAATLTFTGGTQAVVAGSVASVSISQIGATLTFTGGTQTVLPVVLPTLLKILNIPLTVPDAIALKLLVSDPIVIDTIMPDPLVINLSIPAPLVLPLEVPDPISLVV